MSKPASITKKIIDQTAFSIVHENGMQALSTRNVASKAGCSTQPIYKIYQNLAGLKNSVMQQVVDYTDAYIKSYDRSPIQFLNRGLGYIHFAANEKVFFRILRIDNCSNSSTFVPLDSVSLYDEMEQMLGSAEITDRKALFADTMIYTNGLALMAYSGQLGMSEREVAERLASFFFRLSGFNWKEEVYR